MSRTLRVLARWLVKPAGQVLPDGVAALRENADDHPAFLNIGWGNAHSRPAGAAASGTNMLTAVSLPYLAPRGSR